MSEKCLLSPERSIDMKKTQSITVVDRYIGAQIRERRLSLDMSQVQLAKALGVSFQQIQNYEKGINGVSAVRMFDVCNILNVPMASMFPRQAPLEFVAE